jgi:GNAT superfamily N-acetyltransferase
VHYIYHPHNWKREDVCYLQDLYAVPEYRGQGVGRALIEAVYKTADANGTPAVYWLTQDFNQTARQLYDRVATLTPFIKYTR